MSDDEERLEQIRIWFAHDLEDRGTVEGLQNVIETDNDWGVEAVDIALKALARVRELEANIDLVRQWRLLELKYRDALRAALSPFWKPILKMGYKSVDEYVEANRKAIEAPAPALKPSQIPEDAAAGMALQKGREPPLAGSCQFPSWRCEEPVFRDGLCGFHFEKHLHS